MGLHTETIMVVKNVSNKAQRVLTINGKQEINKGKTFKTTKKEAEQLERMYGYLFEIVGKDEPQDETNTDTDDTNTNDTENTTDTNDVENSENTEETEGEETSESEGEEDNEETEETEENVENIENEEIENEVKNTDDEELENLRNAYFEKYGAQVPVNKKNDANRIKSKL